MITTQHILNTENGFNIYLEAQQNGKVSISIQADKHQFTTSSSQEYIYLKGKIDVSDLEELSTYFGIAFDCSL